MESTVYQPEHPIRFVTATSLYDGHDVSINIMRRIMQDSGAEVVHLGHNRSVHEVVDAAIQEDAQSTLPQSASHCLHLSVVTPVVAEKNIVFM